MVYRKQDLKMDDNKHFCRANHLSHGIRADWRKPILVQSLHKKHMCQYDSTLYLVRRWAHSVSTRPLARIRHRVCYIWYAFNWLTFRCCWVGGGEEGHAEGCPGWPLTVNQDNGVDLLDLSICQCALIWMCESAFMSALLPVISQCGIYSICRTKINVAGQASLCLIWDLINPDGIETYLRRNQNRNHNGTCQVWFLGSGPYGSWEREG